MFKKIRTSKFTKFMVYYLSLMLFVEVTQPMLAFGLTDGPSQPEFNAFTPIGTSDMVDLSSGDFNYNIPIMDVGGYPINLAYNSGISMDQEASWVGLGWNLNIGQINRNVRGLPDDFNGDEIKTQNNIRDNITIGVQGYINGQLIGFSDVAPTPTNSNPPPSLSASAGLNLEYNNYIGISAKPSFGLSFKMSDNVSVGMQLSSSQQDGATITPSVSLSAKSKETDSGNQFTGSISPSLTYNSRQGLSSFNINAGIGFINNSYRSVTDKDGNSSTEVGRQSYGSSSGSGSISFLNNTFTPTKRLGLKNNNMTYSFSAGPDIWGGHVEVSISASATVQRLIEREKNDKAYGYEFTDNASEFDLLDFNREKEQSVVTNNTLVLPVTNYTYDILSIQGQALSGTFRPYRGQVSNVYEPKVTDISSSNSFGGEFEGGVGVHVGANFRNAETTSYTSNWTTQVTPFLREKKLGNKINYEKVYFKNVGENRIDDEYSDLFKTKLGDYSPITLKLNGSKQATNEYFRKSQNSNQVSLSSINSFNAPIKRLEREKRNQMIQKVTNFDIERYVLSTLIQKRPTYENFIKRHHTAGYIITDENGSRHIYGETAYNTKKNEVSFATKNEGSLTDGVVIYNNGENSMGNNSGLDHYYNNVETPGYAHTYLLTSILSPDYEDLTLNGVSDDDLGSYTKFEYVKSLNYKWRVPFKFKTASYNEGLKTNKKDQKGSYLYGEKELKYVKKIITKTHVAFIDLIDRNDGYGVSGTEGGIGSSTSVKMKAISKIRLYSKPELELDASGNVMDPINNPSIIPIKTAHFSYDYSLCRGIDNNINTGDGKLTLTKVFFTYKNSNMGRYAAYKFNYDLESNYEYNPKNYDIWGNYKKNLVTSASNNLSFNTPQEFPYVEQNNDAIQNEYARAWSLSSIELPSGGKIEVKLESDDYQYVQNKKAMQMFKVAGVTGNSVISSEFDIKDYLYGEGFEAKYVAIKINQEDINLPNQTIIDNYTKGLFGKAVYFNFFLNMTNDSNDYISGYFEMDKVPQVSPLIASNKYLLIPMKTIDREGKSGNSNPTNPISVAGWFFGREYLQSQLYNGGSFDPSQTNMISIAKSLVNNLQPMLEIFKGPNKVLKQKSCAKKFIAKKSWIRLLEPSGSKLGGGVRVKKIIMKDGWETMLGTSVVPQDLDRYQKKYGQEYDYKLQDGTSSGVATYEPNVCKENPLVQPFYHNPEKMSARTYQEKPFGESFFPNPSVTYRKVTVKNITAADTETVSKTRTGKVITEFYTSYDFPTKTDFTPLDNPIASKYFTNENEAIKNMIKGLLGLKIDVKTELAMSQGFVVETNDMNGKMKKQRILNNASDELSSVEYLYHTEENDSGTLKSELTVIKADGTIRSDAALGMHYDVINDLRESYSDTKVFGVGVNVDVIPFAFIPIVVGMGVPERSTHKQILHTSVTTKVINKTGILKEKIAYDLGSRVSTKNLAWDAQTGQVLLTKTQNEYDDSYYSLNFPAYWHYERMGLASENTDINGVLTASNSSNIWQINGNSTPINKFFKLGDELVTYKRVRTQGLYTPYQWSITAKKVWVSGYNPTNTGVTLMDATGAPYLQNGTGSGANKLYFRVFRSGNRNQQMASMASITLMENPMQLAANGTGILNLDAMNFNTPANNSDNPKIINSSAIQYSQNWLSQCENGLPEPFNTNFNQYLFNVLGEWRPVKSYAYLTGRNTSNNLSTRSSGYYKKFNLFYKRETNNWVIDSTNWTFASKVTKYNPYGVELENMDALNRYSAAQYGYKYKLPVAVGSNSRYQEIGFDGFEDYSNDIIPSSLRPHFGYSDKLNPFNNLTDKTSHTGRKSMMVKPNSRIEMQRFVNGCSTTGSNN